MINVLYLFVTALYFCGAALQIGGALGRKDAMRRMGNYFAAGGFALHTLDLAMVLTLERGLALLQGEFYFSLLAWVLLLIFFLAWWKLKLDFLGLIASSLALILFLASHAITASRLPLPQSLGPLFFGMHIGALFLSIGLLGMAFGAGMAYIYMERKIKTKEKLAGFAKALPSLNAFDLVNMWAVNAGFPLYTLGLVSGFFWAKLVWNRFFSWDPKEITAIFIWILFAFLFHQRLFLGWRGRKTAWMAIWVFCLTLVSMLVINFLMPTHHGFQAQ